MTREQRAKQFAPFDAMKGLREALQRQEELHSRVRKRELDDAVTEQISLGLRRVERGTTVSLVCYHDFHEVTLTGKVTAIDFLSGFLLLGETKIFFEDIYRISFPVPAEVL